MNTTKFYKSMYVSFYRWSFKNFGQGSLPRFNSLFGLNFLLIVLLTTLLLIAQICLKSSWFNVNPMAGTYIMLGAVGALLLNYFVLLNNKRFNKLNIAFEKISKHHQKMWSVMILACVIASCGFLMIIAQVA
ncbi:hypothetical protein [Mucilaginibacter sp. SG564]|uniref:hypothetical protein n=1 Tax=unclassified Mucilaginibacter TaxID=2617802 RepID=UPI001553D4AC|nr:hypothetical protein [Mucilaginibacter sp. SG564]NOW94749.1 hypothetical protein [Mucilaginibacter sp. SG564]